MIKPLRDLVFRLRTLYDFQPVTARSAGILRGNDLDPVTVLDHVVDRYQLAVDPRSDHPVADCTVNAVDKVDRRRTGRKIFHIARRCKTVNALGKQVEITL